MRVINVKDLRQWVAFQKKQGNQCIKSLRRSGKPQDDKQIFGWQCRRVLLDDFERAFILEVKSDNA